MVMMPMRIITVMRAPLPLLLVMLSMLVVVGFGAGGMRHQGSDAKAWAKAMMATTTTTILTTRMG